LYFIFGRPALLPEDLRYMGVDVQVLHVAAPRLNDWLAKVFTVMGGFMAGVGVIVNLAVFFAIHVLWPQGFHGPFEWASAFIGLVAGLALFRFKVGVIPVITGSAVAGLAFQLVRAAI
jgi:hypothetical protein